MRTKMIRDRRKSSLLVEASVEAHGTEVATALDKVFVDMLAEGETMPSFLTVLCLFQRLLAEARKRLISAAARHVKQLDSHVKMRQRRDELHESLETKGRKLRDVLDRLLGEGSGLALAGLDRRAAQEPVELLAQTEHIIERFSAMSEETQGATLTGFVMDPKTIVADFEPEYREFKAILRHLVVEGRRTEATLVAKDRAQDEYDDVFRSVGSVFAACYRVAGYEELARRVTPSSRRSGRTREEPEKPEQETAGPERSESEASAPRLVTVETAG